MDYKGFTSSGTYIGRAATAMSDRAINLYAESVPQEGTENNFVLLGTPGTTLFCTLPTSPIEKIYEEPATQRVFAVAGAVFYEILAGGTYVSYGPIAAGYYTMTSNAQQIMISCASNGFAYIFTLVAGSNPVNTLVQITAAGFPGAVSCCMVDNYFIALVPNSRQFNISSLLDGTQWDALDFALVEGEADNIVAMVADHREIWFLGTRRTEVYVDTGAALFPFERIDGVFVEEGTSAPESLVQLDQTIYFLSHNRNGQCAVWAMNGYVPQRISNSSTEYFFEQYAKNGGVTNARAYAYRGDGGHLFYVISFPSATSEIASNGGTTQGVVNGATWVYDVTTRQWHERAMFPNGVQSAHVGAYHAFGFGLQLVGGGDSTGNIYSMTIDVYTDNGAVINRIRRAPHMVDELKWVKYRRFRLSALVGNGPTNDPDNQFALRCSNDGGNTWSNYYQKPAGDAGNYITHVEWRALGRAMRRAFEVSTSIKAAVTFVDAFLELTTGGS